MNSLEMGDDCDNAHLSICSLITEEFWNSAEVFLDIIDEIFPHYYTLGDIFVIYKSSITQ